MVEPVAPEERITIRSFAAGGLLRLGCLGAGVGWLLFGIFFGLAALFGFRTVTFNGGWAFGLKGLLLSLMIGLLFAVISSFGFLAGALVARRIPRLNELEIWLKDADGTAQNSGD